MEPPLRLEDVLTHLKLNRRYFSLDDPSLLAEIEHKIRMGAQTGLRNIKKLFGKISLDGLCFPEEKKILIDIKVPDIKKRWAESHEICHSLIPTHQYFLHGDGSQTLDPEYHEMIEAEANYGASALIFLSDRFTEEAVDLNQEWKTINFLSKKFGNTMASTLQRYVKHSQNTLKMGLIHYPYWMEKPEGQLTPCRHFIRSTKSEKMFNKISPMDVVTKVDSYLTQRKGGPVGRSEIELADDNGKNHIFIGDSFSNGYYVMTLLTYKGPSVSFF
jgi:hypothetical protein